MSHHLPLRCLMLSRYELEHYTPPARSILISISDSPDDQAVIQVGKWEKVFFHSFIDAGYDEESIQTFGKDFDHVFADYFTPEKANLLRNDIQTIIDNQPDLIVIECDGNTGRAASIAQYLQAKYGCGCEQNTGNANMTILRLLNHDQGLIHSIAAARNGELEAQSDLEASTPAEKQGFFSHLLEIFGIEQKPQ